jgi:hypothetical protein
VVSDIDCPVAIDRLQCLIRAPHANPGLPKMIPSWRFAGFRRRFLDTDWLAIFLWKMLGNDLLDKTSTNKISLLLTMTKDEIHHLRIAD